MSRASRLVASSGACCAEADTIVERIRPRTAIKRKGLKQFNWGSPLDVFRNSSFADSVGSQNYNSRFTQGPLPRRLLPIYPRPGTRGKVWCALLIPLFHHACAAHDLPFACALL